MGSGEERRERPPARNRLTATRMSATSYQRRGRDLMSDDTSETTSKIEPKTDWRRLRSMTDEEVHAALIDDPDAQPTDEAFWKDARVVIPRRKESVTMRYPAIYEKAANGFARDFSADRGGRTALAIERRAQDSRCHLRLHQPQHRFHPEVLCDRGIPIPGDENVALL
jgi:hypothetical protein